jgi:hypothetical protein
MQNAYALINTDDADQKRLPVLILPDYYFCSGAYNPKNSLNTLKSESWYLISGFASPPKSQVSPPIGNYCAITCIEWRRKPRTAKIFIAQATYGLLRLQALNSPRTKAIGSFAGLRPEQATSFWPWQMLHLV